MLGCCRELAARGALCWQEQEVRERAVGHFAVRFQPVSLATMRRVAGATNKTVGNEIAQDTTQLPIQMAGKLPPRPMARKVDRPETMQDIRPDRSNPNRMGA